MYFLNSEGSHFPSKLTASKLFYQPSVTAKDLVFYAQGKENNVTDGTSNMQVKL